MFDEAKISVLALSITKNYRNFDRTRYLTLLAIKENSSDMAYELAISMKRAVREWRKSIRDLHNFCIKENKQ